MISEDEDLDDALKYITQRSKKSLECTIVKREMYDQMRNEQMQNDLNQSKTWIESDQNQFSLESKEIRRKKDPRKTDELPAGLQRVL